MGFTIIIYLFIIVYMLLKYKFASFCRFDAQKQLNADEEKQKVFDEYMDNLKKDTKEHEKELSEKEGVISTKRK